MLVISILVAMFNPVLSPYLLPYGGIPIRENTSFPIYNPSGAPFVESGQYDISTGFPETWDPRMEQEVYAGFSYSQKIKRRILAGFYTLYQGSRLRPDWASLLGGFTSLQYRNWIFGISYNLYSQNKHPLSLSLPDGPWLNTSIKYHPREIAYGNFWGGIGLLNSYSSPLLYWGGMTMDFSQINRFYPDMAWGFAFRKDTLQISIGSRFHVLNRILEFGIGAFATNKDIYNPIGGFDIGVNFRVSDLFKIRMDYGVQIPYYTDDIDKWRHVVGLTINPIRTTGKEKTIAEKSKTESEIIQGLKSKIEALEKERAKLQQQYWTLQEIVTALEQHKFSRVETVYAGRPEAYSGSSLESILNTQGIQIVSQSDTLIHIRLPEKVLAFMPGSDDLPVDGLVILKKIAMFLRQNPNYYVRIEGHTDSVPLGPKGKAKFGDNVGLSLARANAVKDYFVKVEGLDPERFEVKGYGAGRPIATNKTAQGRAKNRRVEIIFKRVEK